jgi:heat shock transcription factor
VLDEDEFAKTLIPELFKHNNYASFVRQLNMYGFHKRVGLSDNSMKASERKNKSPSEYYNPYFKQGHPNLLWLINKAKGGGSKSQKKEKRFKSEDGQVDVDSDDDAKDVEETFYGNNQGSRALSAAPPESGPLQRRDMAVVQGQLADIQKQYGVMSQAISRLRKDHNQLYQQAVAFQTLHDRHESSINAILTFLANVYNRTLDGQGPQNFAQMFTNSIPQEPQHSNQRNVVDIGDLGNQADPNSGNLSPNRRQQRLLMAPPAGRPGMAPGAVPPAQGYSNGPHAGSVEELFEGSHGESPHVTPEDQQGMMDLINNTNARTGPNNLGMEFPEMLSQYENANGNSPLTPDQRNAMLSMIASQSSTPGSNNALVSPTPPPQLSLSNMACTQSEIDDLLRMQTSQEARIREIRNEVAPFSPSGSLAGLNDNTYFPNMESDLQGSNLDLDQYLDTGAFYNGSSPMAVPGGLDLDNFGDGQHFDVGMDGANDAGRIVETTNSSGANTPEQEVKEEPPEGPRSPSKRRRKH